MQVNFLAVIRWLLLCRNMHAQNQKLLVATPYRIDTLLTMWRLACLDHDEMQQKCRRIKSMKQEADSVQPGYENVAKLEVNAKLKDAEQVHLYCGRALTTFAFGNLALQKVLIGLGGLAYDEFHPFMASEDPYLQAFFDFQVTLWNQQRLALVKNQAIVFLDCTATSVAMIRHI